MKKQSWTVITLTSIFALMGVAALAGTMEFGLQADIPFNFLAGETALPAGVYSVSRPSGGVLQLRSTQARNDNAFVLANSTEAARTPHAAQLIFRRYGNQYFLFHVWTGGTDGYSVPKSHKEVELAKTLSERPEIVSVVVAAVH